jgi:hypothetical protein
MQDSGDPFTDSLQWKLVQIFSADQVFPKIENDRYTSR